MLTPSVMVTTKKWAEGLFWLMFIGSTVLWQGCSKSPAQLAMEGEALRLQGHYAEAADQLTLAAASLQTNAIVWNHLGLALHQAGQTARAIQAYEHALALSRERDLGTTATIRFNLGLLHLESGNPREAESHLRAFTVLKPANAEGWAKLGITQLKLRQFDLAEKSLAASRQLEARNPEVLNGLGIIQLQKRRANEAYNYFYSAVQVQKSYAPAWLNLAVVDQQYLNNRPRALKSYLAWLEVAPQGAERLQVEAIAHRLQAELTPPPPKAPATNVIQMAAATNVLPIPPAPVKTNPPIQKLAANTPPSPKVVPLPNTPATQVQLPPEEPIKQATPAKKEVAQVEAPKPKPEPPVESKPTPQPQKESIPTSQKVTASPTVSTVSTNDAAAAKRGFWSKANPVSWFKPSPKRTNDPTPLPQASAKAPIAVKPAIPAPTPLPVAATPTPATRVQQPKPTFPRYVYRNASRPSPGNPAAAGEAYQVGKKANQERRPAEAINAFQKAIAADPASFEAHYALGMLYFEQGDTADALQEFERTLSLKPEELGARLNFANILQRAGYCTDSAIEYEKASRQSPSDVRPHLALGYLYAQKLAEPANARLHYLKVLELDPRNSAATDIRLWLAGNPAN